jgi:hypothetical protein
MNPLFIADLHVHPSMKPFHSGRTGSRKTIWVRFDENNACESVSDKKSIKKMGKVSQASLDQCLQSRTLLLFASLYPVELPWFKMTRIAGIVVGKKKLPIAKCLTNFDDSVLMQDFINLVDYPQQFSFNYFQRLTDEYIFVAEHEDPKENQKVRVLKDFSDYENWKKEVEVADVNSTIPPVGLIINIEGAHVFLDFQDFDKYESYDYETVSNAGWPEYESYRTRILERVEAVKRWGPGSNGDHAPLYISFAHHFWNLLTGHAASMGKCVLNQKEGLDGDITPLGLSVIHKLLEKGENMRRILIDIKHLSVKTRHTFYKLHNDYSLQQDLFPIIASHAAVTGLPYDGGNHPYFNSADINLFDQDIKEIYQSRGLIGIMLEEGRLLNETATDGLAQTHGDTAVQGAGMCAQILLGQLLHVVNICRCKEGWDIVCIGSDFDGMINSLDAFSSVLDYPALLESIRDLLTTEQSILSIDWSLTDLNRDDTTVLFDSEAIHRLKFGLQPDEIVEKIAYKNIEGFLQKFFTPQFLKTQLIT